MNQKEAQAAAHKFDSVISFVRHCSQIVKYATQAGILNEICSHMKDKESLKFSNNDLKKK